MFRSFVHVKFFFILTINKIWEDQRIFPEKNHLHPMYTPSLYLLLMNKNVILFILYNIWVPNSNWWKFIIQICVCFLFLSSENWSPSTAEKEKNKRALLALSHINIRYYWNISSCKMVKNKVLPTQSNYIHVQHVQKRRDVHQKFKVYCKNPYSIYLIIYLDYCWG